MFWAGLAVWLYSIEATEGLAIVCAGNSECLRLGVWCVVEAVANGQCEVVPW
jgi:hypothetical protein